MRKAYPTKVQRTLDEQDVLDSRGIAAAENSFRKEAPSAMPRGLLRLLERRNWVRNAVHDPHSVVARPAPQPAEIDGLDSAASKQRSHEENQMAASPSQRATDMPGHLRIPHKGVEHCVVTFKGARRPGKMLERAAGKFQDKAKVEDALVAPYGQASCSKIVSKAAAIAAGKPLAGSVKSSMPQWCGKRSGTSRQPLSPPVGEPSPVQIELSCAFDSEFGFTEGLYDIDSNTLYV